MDGNSPHTNFMTYNGNHLFHYTSFEAAVKIVATNTLLFGCFGNTNDIAEKSTNILCEVDDNSSLKIQHSAKQPCAASTRVL